MKKEKGYLIIGLVIGLIISFFYCHFLAPRYEIKKDASSMIKIDTWTGKSWRFVDNNWKPMSEMDENWVQVDNTLREALKIPFVKVDSESALKKLKDGYPSLKNIPDDELLERIKLVYSKMVLVNMYLGDFLKTEVKQSGETSEDSGSAK
jgi:hypothetical protein